MAVERHLEHLPPGAVPGPQSTRRRTAVRVGGCLAPALAVAGVLFFMFFAGFAVVFGAISSDLGGDAGVDPAWFWAAAVGGAALFIRIAFVFWRKANPRRDRRMEVRLDRHRAPRGEELRVTVQGIPERTVAEVTLGCKVHWDKRHRSATGDAGDRVGRLVAEDIVWTQSTQASPSGEARVNLPADQPYSHEGEVISFAWLVDARTVVDGRRGRPSLPAAVWVDP